MEARLVTEETDKLAAYERETQFIAKVLKCIRIGLPHFNTQLRKDDDDDITPRCMVKRDDQSTVSRSVVTS